MCDTLKIKNNGYIQKHQRKWNEHLNRMNKGTEQILHYQPRKVQSDVQ